MEHSNRPASLKEMEMAYQALLNLGESLESKLLKLSMVQYQNHPYAPVSDASFPMVVTDFSAEVASNVILVPPGIYTVPEAFFIDTRYIIGLTPKAEYYPTLLLQGHEASVTKDTTIHIFEPDNPYKFAQVRLDAETPTVIKVWNETPELFSDKFMHVTYGDHIEVVDDMGGVYMLGRLFAIQAFKGRYNLRSTASQMIDSVHEGGLKVIDGIFRPLVTAAGWIDKLLA